MLNRADYRHHGAGNQVVIVRCPGIAGDHLVHLSQAGQQSWVIRDYVSGEELFRSPPPNRSVSGMDLNDIEMDADYSEPPAYHAETHRADWEAYLRLRTMVVFGLRRPPASAAGSRPTLFAGNHWQPF